MACTEKMREIRANAFALALTGRGDLATALRVMQYQWRELDKLGDKNAQHRFITRCKAKALGIALETTEV